MTALASMAVLLFLSVALTPPLQSGGWWFLGQMAAGQVFLGGVVTVRSALWKANYPHAHRGRITARLQLFRLLTGVTGMTVAGLIFDRDSTAYRWVYPMIALIGAVGVVLLQRIRVRNERSELRRGGERSLHTGPEERVLEPFSLVAVLSPGHVISQMVRVLKENPRFARYNVSLMFTGIGNLLVAPVMASIVAHDLALSYIACVALLDIIPLGLMMITLPRWAPFFDRVGVVNFRVTNGVCWTAFLVLGTMATYLVAHRADSAYTMPLALTMYGLSRIANGMARGGAALAWHLGHYHFARPRESEMLMGVHVTLTGLRGLTIPFLGIWLWSRIGWWVWLIATGFCLVGVWGYVKMARDERADGR
jgi:hypothetical protein